eukprot:NODE_7497_length_453_cov_59.103960_g6661_i0.p1 GENE.NODE_7497_length_453_cov_59.103960_g6661_i0~~NODE_7497_length_453_cov_59.103960_g6661_i0.p1  ORF type:complete len:95 (-),score=7.59 NODE_7497_length_453_cov_59.103960_g6661_i0:33-317(-)
MQNTPVVVIGKVEDYIPENSTCVIRTSDGTQVMVNTLPDQQIANVTEFYGMVSADGRSLKELSRSDIIDDFDFESYNHLLGLMHGPFRHLFFDN